MKPAFRYFTIFATLLVVSCATTPAPAPALSPDEVSGLFESLPRITREGTPSLEPPKALKRVDPQPDADFRARYHFAYAKIEAIIDEEGKVIATRYVEGHPEWARVLERVARHWQFSPAKVDGKPVKFRFELTSTYRG